MKLHGIADDPNIRVFRNRFPLRDILGFDQRSIGFHGRLDPRAVHLWVPATPFCLYVAVSDMRTARSCFR